jgi:hypothetical protein
VLQLRLALVAILKRKTYGEDHHIAYGTQHQQQLQQRMRSAHVCFAYQLLFPQLDSWFVGAGSDVAAFLAGHLEHTHDEDVKTRRTPPHNNSARKAPRTHKCAQPGTTTAANVCCAGALCCALLELSAALDLPYIA